jgi:mannose-1-phosphate guanylyltransferase
MSESVSVYGIVVAGAYPARPSALDALTPRPLLPVAQQPLITYALRWLSKGGVERATICANSAARAIRARLDTAALGMQLAFLEDWNPRGAAGCVRDAGARREARTFVVADGTSVPVVELGDLVESHRAAQALLTVAVAPDATGRLAPCGVYVFDRRAFDYIPADGFQDIKERLLPRLYEAGEPVATHVAATAAPRVVNVESYLALDHWAVERLARQALDAGDYHLQGDAIVHGSAVVDPAARLLGPVLVGPGVTIGRGATLVGPLSLGPGTRVGRAAVVSRSVAWSGCVIGDEALVDRCMLADEARVDRRTPLFGSVRVAERPRPTRLPGRSLWQPLVAALKPAAPADQV